MTKHALRYLTTLLLAWLFFTAIASAHSIHQTRGEILLDQKKWTADLWLEGWSLYPLDGPFSFQTDPREPGLSGPSWIATLDNGAWEDMKKFSKTHLKDTFQLHLDDQLLDFQISFPDRENSSPNTPLFTLNEDGNVLVKTRLTGSVPPNSHGQITLSWKDYFDSPLTLTTALTVTGKTSHSVSSLDTPTVKHPLYTLFPDGHVILAKSPLNFLNWIQQGFLHILPKGLDHILFVLGLFLLQPKAKPLLTQTASFTIAHSITLALVVLGVITVPSRLVEAMIALSIAYVGIENLWIKEVKPHRIFFIFALGLLHGMGFASVMQELDIPTDSLIKPLIGFNLGVELGQITVLLSAFALTFWALKKPKFELFRKTASALIAAIGLYWTVERLMG